MLELEDLLELATKVEGAPFLARTGAYVRRDGEEADLLSWSAGGIGAVAGARWVAVDRLDGAELSGGPPLRFAAEGLRRLEAACRDWIVRRAEWEGFRVSRAASAQAGSFERHGHTPRGPDSKERTVYSKSPSFTMGSPFGGRDEERPLLAPLDVAPGVVAVAELWRVGEVVAEPAGVLVGIVYSLGEGLRMEARRSESRVLGARGNGFRLLPGEEPFVGALRRHLEQRGAGKAG